MSVLPRVPRALVWVLALCALGSLAALAPRLLSAQTGQIQGVVTDLATGAPIAEAEIRVADQLVRSDKEGRYLLKLTPGRYDVSARAPGYIGMTYTRHLITATEAAPLDLAMIPQHPSAEVAAALDARLHQLSQEGPSEAELEALLSGYAPSAVTQVPRTLRVLMPDDSVVVMEMDEYLKGVVPHEVPPSWPRQSLLAQAVAARSVAATSHRHGDQGADICTTVHCQVWKPTHYDTTDEAVDATHGEAIWHSGSIVYAYFFGHCDGHTRNSEDVWTAALPYCRSVVCPCGYGELFGHGVGMCQQGARVLAQQGQGYADILRHYYTGVAVARAGSSGVTSGVVWPLAGDENTQFTYEARYASSLGDLPAAAHVIIDGRAQALDRVAYESGEWVYRLVTRLSAGAHGYRFYFDDGYGHVSMAPGEGPDAGPEVTVPDPATPTPTLVPAWPTQPQVFSQLASTAIDWSEGATSDLQIVGAGDGALTLAEGAAQGVYQSAVISAPWPIEALGIVWQAQLPAGSSVTLEAQTFADGQGWSPWRALPPAEDGPARHGVSASGLVPVQASAIRYRANLLASGSGASPLLEAVRVVCLASAAGAPVPAREAGSILATVAAPPMVSRAAWGADESLMSWPPEYRLPQASVLHHTGAPLDGVDPAGFVQSLYFYDAVVRQQGDIGYNYLIDPQGSIYEGRAGGLDVVGAHAGRFDWGSIGIALIGDHDHEPVSAAALESLTDLLAWRCAELYIDPTVLEATFLDQLLPTIMSHRDCAGALCAGDELQALLPTIRQTTLDKIQQIAPQVELLSPIEGGQVRAVVRPGLNASAVITRVTYYVDGALAGSDAGLPGAWRWNTLGVADGAHTLRVLVENAVGSAEDQVQVLVDNTPPDGSVAAPRWVNSPSLSLSLQSQDATQVQLSNDWVWEGEDLLHAEGSGRQVADAQALNGLAWQGLGGADAPGGWFGPYACGLASWSDYVGCFRIKSPESGAGIGLATLDIVDDQGRRRYAERPLAANDLAQAGFYEDICLDLSYESRWPTCDDPEVDDGLEFRTWFSAAGDLYLDRITVYEAAVAFAGSMSWAIPNQEGEHVILVRLLDQAGNSLDAALPVYLDKTLPAWSQSSSGSVCARDEGAGLALESARWSSSADGATWSSWAPLALEGEPGALELCWAVPATTATYARFQMADRAGNSATSPAYPVAPQTPASPTVTATVSPSATATQSPTVSATVSASPTATELPTATDTALPTPTETVTPEPTPTATPKPPTWTPDPGANRAVLLPLVLR